MLNRVWCHAPTAQELVAYSCSHVIQRLSTLANFCEHAGNMFGNLCRGAIGCSSVVCRRIKLGRINHTLTTTAPLWINPVFWYPMIAGRYHTAEVPHGCGYIVPHSCRPQCCGCRVPAYHTVGEVKWLWVHHTWYHTVVVLLNLRD